MTLSLKLWRLLGNLPSLFPSLISDITQKSELTVTRHCANKFKIRKLLPNNHNNFNNNVMNVNHNRRGCRQLNALGPTTNVCAQPRVEGRRLANF